MFAVAEAEAAMTLELSEGSECRAEHQTPYVGAPAWSPEGHEHSLQQHHSQELRADVG